MSIETAGSRPDLRLPGLSGRELMEKVKAANPDLPVVIMTAYASLKEAVEIIKEGAFDYTVKPFELDALEATIASALRYYALGRDNRDLREHCWIHFRNSIVYPKLRRKKRSWSIENVLRLWAGLKTRYIRGFLSCWIVCVRRERP